MGVLIGGGITIDAGVTIKDVGTALGNYRLVSGAKLPTLGDRDQTTFPETGWTSLVSATNDDASIDVTLPFTWRYNSVGYTTVSPNSNFYITFGTGSTVFSALANNNPALNKIFFAGADNSWQRVSRITSGTDYLRIRWEGSSSTSGVVGNPNMVYELTFFNPTNTGNNSVFELLVGVQNRANVAGIISGICSNTALLASLATGNRGVAQYQSYVGVGDANGATWTVHTGYHIQGAY